jgi:glutamine cyclotransferase
MPRAIITASAAAILIGAAVLAVVATGPTRPASIPGAPAAVCSPPTQMLFRVDSEIRRHSLGFTQGLELYGDRLFESTGAIAGDSRLTTINPDGRVSTLANFGKTIFGEGLTILDDQIFQLTWQDHQVLVHDLDGALVRRMENPRDGWGLTNDGSSLIFTDGGDRLYYADPANFDITHSVQVRIGDNPIGNLNELEFVDGKIYANIFTTRAIIRLDPQSGCVEAVSQLDQLWERMSLEERRRIASSPNFVLNGIAFDQSQARFYLTGKNWAAIYLGRFEDAY